MAILTGETYDTREQRRDQLPDLGRDEAAKVPFHFIFSPGSWECVDLDAFGIPETERSERFEWVPRLKKFFHMAGCNGVSARAGGLGRALGEWRERGWVVIDPEHGPDGTSYVRRIRTKRGDRYTDAWTGYVPSGINRMAPRYDDAGYLRWRRELVIAGVIPLPPPEVIDGQIEPLEQEIRRLENRAHIPHVAAKIEALAAKLAGMKARTFPAPPPKRSRRNG